jgi:hypothetical protein
VPVGPLFAIAETRLLHIDENSGCMGNHNFFVQVRDQAGNPLNGVVVCRYWSLQIGDPAACKISGVTDDKPDGQVEFDLYSSGDQLFVASDESGQNPLSDLTVSLSMKDEEIPIDWLIWSGYCENQQDCQTRIAENRLCRGHYSYSVIFQRTR